MGCTRTLSLEVELYAPERPDPFEGVETVRLVALTAAGAFALGEDRWDQGPIRLPLLVDPGLERLLVLGLSDDGSVRASGSSGALDLLSTPPDRAIRVYFSREGALSVAEERAERRSGARAATLPDGRVIFAGGAGEDGCLLESSLLFGAAEPRLSAGPPVPGGRIGAFSLTALSSGEVLVAGGDRSEDCRSREAAIDLVLADPFEGGARVVRGSMEIAGAAIAAVSERQVLIGGGSRDGVPISSVSILDASTGALSTVGLLDGPRASSVALPISEGRVAFAGGRSRADPSSALGSVTVFVPSRGAALPERIPLGAPVARPVGARSRAGSLLVAGTSGGRTFVRAVVVKSERAVPLGDTSTVAVLSSSTALGQMLDLDDGSLLLFFDDLDRPLEWIKLLPLGREEVALPEGVHGPLVGGRLEDGSAVLAANDGTLLTFNPGPGGVLGARAALRPEEGRPLGLVPLRPSAWRFTEGGLEGVAPPVIEGPLSPRERVVLSRDALQDFELEVTLTLHAQAKASILFGVEEDELDQVLLHGVSSVERSFLRALRRPLTCQAAETRALSEPRPIRVLVRRVGSRVTVDLGADGSEELACDTPDPARGLVALGVVSGRVTFGGISLRSR